MSSIFEEKVTCVRYTACCAVHEIDNLSLQTTPHDALIKVFSHLRIRPVPFVLFTGVTTRRGVDHVPARNDNYGLAFKEYLEANGLGTVLQSEERRNLAYTGNGVTVWLWYVDNDKLAEWGTANGFVRGRNERGLPVWQQTPNL